MSKKIKKIKSDNGKNIKKQNDTVIAKVLNLVSVFTSKFDNKDSIRLKFIRAGSPFQWIGITEKNFTGFKLIFMLFIMMIVGLDNDASWTETILYGIGSYGFIEYFIRIKINKRQKEIKKEIDVLISTTIECLGQGLTQGEVFSVLVNRINKENPLYQELIRAKIKVGVNALDVNFDSILDEMQDRIGMEEIDNYCLALKQQEMAGKAIRMLKKQLELIRSRENLRQRRETQYKANLNSMSIILFVVCITLVIAVPMIIIVLQNPIFN